MNNIRCLLIFTSRGIKIRDDDGRLKSIERRNTQAAMLLKTGEKIFEREKERRTGENKRKEDDGQ